VSSCELRGLALKVKHSGIVGKRINQILAYFLTPQVSRMRQPLIARISRKPVDKLFEEIMVLRKRRIRHVNSGRRTSRA